MFMQNPVKLSVRCLKDFDRELVSHQGTNQDKFKMALLCPHTMAFLQASNDNCHPYVHGEHQHEPSKMSLILYINQRDFKLYNIDKVDESPNGDLRIKEAVQNKLRLSAVIAYKDVVFNNNYLCLLDAEKQRCYYRKTMPIDDGTFIIDVVHNKLTNIDEHCQEKTFELERPTVGKAEDKAAVEVQGNYGKRILKLPENMDEHTRSLSEHLTVLMCTMTKEKDDRKKQIMISKKFQNLARCEDEILLWNESLKTYSDEDLQIEHLEPWYAEVFTRDRSSKAFKVKEKVQQFQKDYIFGKALAYICGDKKEHGIYDPHDGELGGERKIELKDMLGIRDNDDCDADAGLNLARQDGFEPIEEWRVIFERIRFENDDRTVRPLVICHCRKRQSRFHQTEQLEDLNIFFCIFDFYD